jgi:hypothetical protein
MARRPHEAGAGTRHVGNGDAEIAAAQQARPS